MCTVLFIPTKDGYFISSNRDEDPKRGIDTALEQYSIHNYQILSPISLSAFQANTNKISWIAANHQQSAFVLLNGGIVNHIKQPSYRASRGTIIEHIVFQNNPIHYLKTTSLEGIEPFSLVILCDNSLYEFIWTGLQKIIYDKPKHKPHIWSSSTLYSPDIKHYRTTLFENYLAQHTIFNFESLSHFYQTYNDNQNGFLLNRSNLVKTISISIIKIEPNRLSFEYKNLLNPELNNTLYLTNSL